MLEALVAMSMGASLLVSITYLAYSYSNAGAPEVVLHEAVFDIAGIAYRNSTFRSCLAIWDQACIISYLSEFRNVYSLGYVGVQRGSESVYSGTRAECASTLEYCIPMQLNAAYNEYCFALCGG
ncbi:MAG: hypothetical protein M1158_04395 [Candidatus Marsarchaeota archaeon]|jgi:hypothetical protein|nr:hypothetical protein [Candidatus Marsarchaeota archaeon]